MRLIFWAILLIEAPLQLIWTLQWSKVFGFWGGCWHWLSQVQTGDALTRAATVDFILLATLIGFWILKDYPRKKFSLRFLSWCVLYVFFPSLGGAVYFLFMNPRHLAKKQA